MIRILLDVAMGVAHLHQESIVHRDIASRNVLVLPRFSFPSPLPSPPFLNSLQLTSDRRAKISDFGFAKVEQRHQRHDDRKFGGPVRWMAPEALTFGAFSVPSDVWSYGMLIYECVVRISLPSSFLCCLIPSLASYLLTQKARSIPHKDKVLKELAVEIGSSGITPVLPPDCPPPLLEITKACWALAPSDRATFHWIITHLAEHSEPLKASS